MLLYLSQYRKRRRMRAFSKASFPTPSLLSLSAPRRASKSPSRYCTLSHAPVSNPSQLIERRPLLLGDTHLLSQERTELICSSITTRDLSLPISQLPFSCHHTPVLAGSLRFCSGLSSFTAVPCLQSSFTDAMKVSIEAVLLLAASVTNRPDRLLFSVPQITIYGIFSFWHFESLHSSDRHPSRQKHGNLLF